MDNRQFPVGFNYQCPLCGEFHSVADADLPNFVCTICKGMGNMQRFGAKAVVVPKTGIPPAVNKFQFRDERFFTDVKDSSGDQQLPVQSRQTENNNQRKVNISKRKKGSKKK